MGNSTENQTHHTEGSASKIAKTTFIGLSIAAIALLLILALGDLHRIDNKLDQVLSSLTTESSATSSVSPEEIAKMVREQMVFEEEQEKLRAFERVSAKYDAADRAISDSEPVYGNPDAEFTIIEFSDFECPYCAKFHEVPKKVVDLNQGKVNWAFKHFPLGFHNPAAKEAAIYSECVKRNVGNRAFWAFSDLYFSKSQLNGKGIPADSSGNSGVREVALMSGIEPEVLDACVDSPEVEQYVDNDMEFGRKYGVNGTPGVFVLHAPSGQVQQVGGYVPADKIIQAMNRMKNAANNNASSQAGKESTPQG